MKPEGLPVRSYFTNDAFSSGLKEPVLQKKLSLWLGSWPLTLHAVSVLRLYSQNPPEMRFRFLLVFLAFLLIPGKGSLFAQVEGISIVSAQNYFADKDYRNAFAGFEDYLQNIRFDRDIAYKAGISACRMGIGNRAIFHLQTARDAGLNDNYLSYWLGRSFLQDEQWDSAQIYLERYMEVFPVDKAYQNEASAFLRNISVAKNMVSKTLQPVVIENMGPGINSPYSEFHPMITFDGQTLVINSRKKGFIDEKLFDDGEFKEKIFVCKKQEDGSWSRSTPIRLNEGRNRDNDYVAIQLINNDSKLLLYKIFQETAHLYVSDYVNGTFKVPYQIPIEPDPRFFTGDIYFSNDLKHCVFTMDGKTNYFQNDLYTSTYDDKNEKWSEPVSLGKNINTNREEGSPFLLNDSVLYFSSKSENGLGEFDIFRAEKGKDGAWSEAKNLGFPYNTANNDLYFYISQTDTAVHYISSVRGSSKGLADIYKVRRTALANGSGKILDDGGQPVVNTSFKFEDPENFQSIFIRTDAEGRFNSEFVAGVNYGVSLSRGGKVIEGNYKIAFPLVPGDGTNVEIRLSPKVLVKPETPMDSVE
jgi:hypothetical protein